MNKEQMQKFLEDKGIEVTKSEGDDFSAVFHISADDRVELDKNKTELEKETGLYFATSDMYGMSVVIMENHEQ